MVAMFAGHDQGFQRGKRLPRHGRERGGRQRDELNAMLAQRIEQVFTRENIFAGRQVQLRAGRQRRKDF